MTAADTLQDDRRCFACGPDNQAGLQMHFDYEPDIARCRVVPNPNFSGWSDMLHGGVVATLLDEAMAHAAIAAGVRAVTARLEVRFRKAVPIGAPLVLEGKIVGRRGKMLDAVARLSGEDGTLYAEGSSRFISQ
jgi:acyl-coenzyme A thioesterase PaaI-like protein